MLSSADAAENILAAVLRSMGASLLHDTTAGKVSAASALSPELHEAVRTSWRATYGLLFGKDWVDTLGGHHIKTIRWHWAARHRICRGEEPWQDYFADFPMWSRGHAKSTIARRIAIVDAIIELSTRKCGS